MKKVYIANFFGDFCRQDMRVYDTPEDAYNELSDYIFSLNCYYSWEEIDIFRNEFFNSFRNYILSGEDSLEFFFGVRGLFSVCEYEVRKGHRGRKRG